MLIVFNASSRPQVVAIRADVENPVTIEPGVKHRFPELNDPGQLHFHFDFLSLMRAYGNEKTLIVKLRDRYRPEEKELIFQGSLITKYPGIYDQHPKCPVCGIGGLERHTLAHLQAAHNWSDETLELWVKENYESRDFLAEDDDPLIIGLFLPKLPAENYGDLPTPFADETAAMTVGADVTPFVRANTLVNTAMFKPSDERPWSDDFGTAIEYQIVQAVFQETQRCAALLENAIASGAALEEVLAAIRSGPGEPQ
ncbi:MAG TPA: hypothetical protein VFC63_25340 [Blastocatellia bacterium]|nr:hypothetical protein [Blastocatellia bacterium]